MIGVWFFKIPTDHEKISMIGSTWIIFINFWMYFCMRLAIKFFFYITILSIGAGPDDILHGTFHLECLDVHVKGS